MKCIVRVHHASRLMVGILAMPETKKFNINFFLFFIRYSVVQK